MRGKEIKILIENINQLILQLELIYFERNGIIKIAQAGTKLNKNQILIEELNFDTYKYNLFINEIDYRKNVDWFLNNLLKELIIFLNREYELLCINNEKVLKFVHEIYSKAVEDFLKECMEVYAIDIEILQQISAMRYEKEATKGFLFFKFEKEKPDTVFSFEHESKIVLKKEFARNIRKLLQTTQEMKKQPAFLVFEYSNGNWELTGLAEKNVKQYEGIWVEFSSHMVWKLGWKDRTIVQFQHNTCKNPIEHNQENFEAEYTKVFKKSDTIGIWSIIGNTKLYPHGAIFIIMETAAIKKEVNRLTGYMIHENGIQLSENLAMRLANLDGAVFVGTDGNVYGFGMILDGISCAKGDSSRGSRYNSTHRYIATKVWSRNNPKIQAVFQPEPAIGVIVSEDGMVDFIGTEDNFS